MNAIHPDPNPPSRALPRQERSQQTYDLLLRVAGELLAEIGMDAISTNLICARAGLTPPALYRYFDDKYAVLEALARRLMTRQNVVLEQWIERHDAGGMEALSAHVIDLLRDTAVVTASEPGAVWILRALHASPRMVHIRVESHRYVTDRLVEAFARHRPDIDRDELWQRLRLAVEIGFAVDEMLQEEDRIPAEMALQYAATVLRGALD